MRCVGFSEAASREPQALRQLAAGEPPWRRCKRQVDTDRYPDRNRDYHPSVKQGACCRFAERHAAEFVERESDDHRDDRTDWPQLVRRRDEQQGEREPRDASNPPDGVIEDE